MSIAKVYVYVYYIMLTDAMRAAMHKELEELERENKDEQQQQRQQEQEESAAAAAAAATAPPWTPAPTPLAPCSWSRAPHVSA